MKHLLLKLLLFSTVFMGSVAHANDTTIAIVVHPDTNVSDLSMDQLRKIFLADQQFWPDKSRITLLVRAPKAADRDLVLNHIYLMSEAQFRQYWVAKMFRAEVTSGPKLVFSSTMALDLLMAIRGSIAFVNASEINDKKFNDKIKILRINGLLPSDAAYPLRSP